MSEQTSVDYGFTSRDMVKVISKVDSSVALNYNGSKTFETNASGVSITGNITGTSASFTNGSFTNLDVDNNK